MKVYVNQLKETAAALLSFARTRLPWDKNGDLQTSIDHLVEAEQSGDVVGLQIRLGEVMKQVTYTTDQQEERASSPTPPTTTVKNSMLYKRDVTAEELRLIQRNLTLTGVLSVLKMEMEGGACSVQTALDKAFKCETLAEKNSLLEESIMIHRRKLTESLSQIQMGILVMDGETHTVEL